VFNNYLCSVTIKKKTNNIWLLHKEDYYCV